MTAQFFTDFHAKQPVARLASLFVLLILVSLLWSPEAQAQCSGAIPGTASSGGVQVAGCDLNTGNTNNNTLDVPAGTVDGDLLIAAISVDANTTFTAPTGWIKLQSGSSDANSLAIFKRIADSEPGSYNFTWATSNDFVAMMLRITGAEGLVQTSIRAANGNTDPAPVERVKGLEAGDLVLRIGSFDTGGIGGSVPLSHVEVTRSQSGGGNGEVKLFAFSADALISDSLDTTIDHGESQEYVTSTLGIQQAGGANFTSCPTIDGSVTGSQLVVLEQCTLFQAGTDNQTLTANVLIETPSLAQVGDLLVIVINTDGNELPFSTTPVGDGFTLINDEEGNGITAATYARTVDGTEPLFYEWALNSNEQRTGYMMLFSGASGVIVESVPPINEVNGSSASVDPPPITTIVDDTLLVRTAVTDDDDITVTPGAGNILSGHTNIVARSSREGGNAVSSQAAYVNQVAAGLTDPAGTFPVNTTDESHKASTYGIEPIQFRFEIDDPNYSLCVAGESTVVTISAVNSAGVVLPNFTGTVRLATSGTAGGAGTWAVDPGLGDPPAVGAVLDNNPGGAGSTTDGLAEYTFVSGDGGTVQLEFTTTVPGELTFDLEWDLDRGGGTRTFTETKEPNATFDYDPTLTIANCHFRVTYPDAPDGEMGTCAVKRVQIDLVDEVTGVLADNYPGGRITIDNLQGHGDYTKDSGDGTIFSAPGDGTVEVDFLANENSIILNYTDTNSTPGGFDFDVSEDSGLGFVESPDAPVYDLTYDPTLLVFDCVIQISYPIDATSDVCSITAVRFTIVANGNTITNYDGDIDLSVDGTTLGDWQVGLPTGSGLTEASDLLLDNSVGGFNNGQATYDFDGTEGGFVDLGFRTTNIDATTNFNASGTATNSALLATDVGADPDMDIAGCTVVITSDNSGDTCRAGEIVTYTIQDRDSATAVDFNGLLVLQVTVPPSILPPGVGDFAFSGTAPSGDASRFTPLGSNIGQATYQFDPDAVTNADAGVLEVVYTLTSAETVLVSGSSTSVTPDDSDGTIDFTDCEFRINFVQDPLDANTPGDLTPGTTDVCSIEVVEIRIVDSSGAEVQDYTGTITLETSTGFGTWSVRDATNAITDSEPEDGLASYVFHDDDDGVIYLDFTHRTSDNAAVNIDIESSDGIVSDRGIPGDVEDPNLVVNACTFEISFDDTPLSFPLGHANTSMTACEVQTVTIEIFDWQGNADTDYDGTVKITTSGNNGDWSGTGALTNNGNGEAFYTFVPGDTGFKTLNFTNLNTEIMSVDLIDQVPQPAGLTADGVIEEVGSADPNLTITSCIPAVSAESCVAGTTTTLTVPAQNTDPTLRGRAVVMAISYSGNSDVSNARFDTTNISGATQNMYQIFEEVINDGGNFNTTEVWGIKETASFGEGTLPANLADTVYTVDFVTTDPDPAMCVFALNDIAQVYPTAVANPNEDDGTVNGTQATAQQIASTTVTTAENNSLLMSFVSNGDTADTYDLASPNPPLPDPQNPAAQPGAGNFAYTYGVLPTQASVTVDMTWNEGGAATSPNRHTHVVAAFEPLIGGSPIANGYEPVTLFQTYSGNISYRAIGNTLRTTNNDGGVCNANNFASADLTLPEIDEFSDPLMLGYDDSASPGDDNDSTVLAAYLYWFGSGDVGNPPGGVNFDQITFVSPLGSTNITADELFDVQNVGNANDKDYFAAYKDVTALIVQSTTATPTNTYTVQNHPAQFTALWCGTGAAGGGFALVVVYDNIFEQLRVINLFHGFQPFQDSAFTLIPRNFRMAEPNPVGEVPNGQVTHITLEGDETIFDGDESLKLQDLPGSTNPADFLNLFTDYNPEGHEFNGTVTAPIYIMENLGGGVFKYQWDDSAGNGDTTSNGYQIFTDGVVNPADFDPDASPDPIVELGNTWGVDVDTHYISGDEDPAINPDLDGNYLFEFADVRAEEITTRYASGGDLVLLISEVISVVNEPIADLEITLTETSPSYTVNSTGSYSIDVKNNGSGASDFGTATGNLTVTGEFPAGYTFAAAGDVSGTGWDCTTGPDSGVTLNPAAFTCNYDIAANIGSLGNGSVPALNFTVQIGGPPTDFPSLSNDAEVIVRLQHNDGTCTATTIGQIPDPAGCESPEFDNVNDLQGGAIDINDIDEKQPGINNNVDSITTEVRGIETDLGITKALQGILEEDVPLETADYLITVTNYGPDDILPSLTTPTITVTDAEPLGIQFDSVVADAGWTCGDPDVSPPNLDPITNTGTSNLECRFDGTLLAGLSTTITLTVEVDGTAGQGVINSVSVAPGLYNFDVVNTAPGNNSAFDSSTIQAPPAGSTELFLLSVSSDLNNSDLGSLAGLLEDFEDGDLILYDPVGDVATYFYDDDGVGLAGITGAGLVTDINAVHLQPNGQVILSAASNSTIGTVGILGTASPVAFEPDDLVAYDPVTQEATLFFQGDDYGPTTDVNIDAVYVLSDGSFVFSTEFDVAGGIGWSDSDLVRFDPTAGAGLEFSIYLDGDDDTYVFPTPPDPAEVDAMYIRVDPDDANAVEDIFIFSSNVELSQAGQDNGIFGQDDVIELTLDSRSAPTTSTTDNLFAGNVPIGVFAGDGLNSERRLNALHILEEGYLGNFSIAESQAGTACEPGKIRIRKHENFMGDDHTIDTDYAGPVLITTSTGEGTWSIDTGSGTLIDSTPDDGIAVYIFDASDNGEVILNLDIPNATTLNIDVTNGLVSEFTSPVDDPTITYNLVVTNVTYRDNFLLAALDNDDGSSGWADEWQEVDGLDGTLTPPGSGDGAGVGNAQIGGDVMTLTSNPTTDGAGIDPSFSRRVDLSLYNATQDVILEFEYTYENLNLADAVAVEVDDGVSGWVQVALIDNLAGDNASPSNVTINLSAFGGGSTFDFIADPTPVNPEVSVRFRIDNGYTLGSTMFIEFVEIATGTTDCGIGVIDHFGITVASSGVACVASTVTITGLDANNFPSDIPSGTSISLSTKPFNEGTWASILSGSGILTDIGATVSDVDGMADFTFVGTQQEVQLQFNYTSPSSNGELVNFDIAGVYTEIDGDPIYDQSIAFDQAGLVFYNETTASTTLPFQIAGKPSSSQAPTTGTITVQLMNSVETPGVDAAIACESLIGDGTTASITLAGNWDDPGSSSVNSLTFYDDMGDPLPDTVPIYASGVGVLGGGGQAVDLLFEQQGGSPDNIGAVLDFSYADVGRISLHGEYEIPFDNDVDGIGSGDIIDGDSEVFVVRPFGFDVDFSADRRTDTDASLAADSNGPPFARAGVGFNATVAAVIWQEEDDDDALLGEGDDGLPDFDADLSNNPIAPSFGEESIGANHVAVINIRTDDPTVGGLNDNPGVPGGVVGSLIEGDTGNTAVEVFDGFSNGSSSHNIAIDEVGIFDIDARLVVSAANQTNEEYFGTSTTNGVTPNVSGSVLNVGRIYPYNFVVDSSSFSARPNQTGGSSSPFTYFGEEFGLNITLQAKNFDGDTTLNYFDDFAKLVDFTELDIRGIIDVGSSTADIDIDVDLPSLNAGDKLLNSSIPTDFSPGMGNPWLSGQLTLSGNMIVSRRDSGAEEAPLVGLQIAFAPTDGNGDGIGGGNDITLDPSVFNVDLDDGTNEDMNFTFFELAEHEFRYGRLVLENAYGPETEDIDIPISVEYFDGTDFILNTDDDITSITFDFNPPAPPPTPPGLLQVPALDFIAGTYQDGLSDGDTAIENDEDFTLNLFNGRTARQQDGNTDDDDDTDRPFFSTAPDPTADLGISGRVLIELDLDSYTLSTPLDFLGYDWRDVENDSDPYDEQPDGDDVGADGSEYNDNPRSVIEFGSYRGHDRVINWQELYIGN